MLLSTRSAIGHLSCLLPLPLIPSAAFLLNRPAPLAILSGWPVSAVVREHLMQSMIVESDDLSVLNHCTKHLARPGDPATDSSEAWRYPIIAPHRATAADHPDDPYNEVTFVYR